MQAILTQGNKRNIEANESKMDVYASSQSVYSIWVLQHIPKVSTTTYVIQAFTSFSKLYSHCKK